MIFQRLSGRTPALVRTSEKASPFAPRPFALPARKRSGPLEIADRRGVVQRLGDQEIEEAVTALQSDVSFRSAPNTDQVEEINDLLFTSNTEKITQALNLIKKYYGIGFVEDVVRYDPKLKDEIEGEVEASTDPGKDPILGYYAIKDAKDLGESFAHIRLALTIAHEDLHRQQFRRLGDFDMKKVPRNVDRETFLFISENEKAFHEVQAYTSETFNLSNYTRLKYGSVARMPKAEKEQLIKFKKDAQKKRAAQLVKPGNWENQGLQARQTEVNSLLLGFQFKEALKLIRTDDAGYYETKYAAGLEDKTHYV